MDPILMGVINALFQEVKAGQELMRNTQLQTAQMMGEFTELRRQQEMAPAYPPAPTMPAPQAPIFQAPTPQPMPQPQGYRPAAGKFDPFRGGIPTPPGYQAVFSHAPLPGGSPIEDFPGWWWIPTVAQQPAPQPQPQYQAPTGTGYPMPPGYPQPPQYPSSPYPQPQSQPAQVSNPLSGLDASVSTLVGAMKSIKQFEQVARSFNGGGMSEMDDDEPVEVPNPVTPPPVSTMPLPGGGVMAFNQDGSPNWATTAIGNIPKITEFINTLGNTAMTIHNAQKGAMAAQTPQHVERVVLPPPAPPQVQTYQALPQARPVPHPMNVPPPPQTAPPQPPVQSQPPAQTPQNSFLPNAAALRVQP
jgi:hypothetical protein